MAEMVTISKRRTLSNPGKRRKRRNLSPLQKLFFGSKRQRAAVKANRGRKRKRRNVAFGYKTKRRPLSYTVVSKPRRKNRARRRRRNVSHVLSVLPTYGMNPGRKRRKKRSRNRGKRVIIVNKGVKMARTRKRRYHRRKAVSNPRRRRRNVHYVRKIKRGMYKYSNPGYRRRRRRNVSHRRRHHRRNPGMLSGTVGRVVGVIGGIAITKVLCGFLPASLTSGPLGYLATGAVAVMQGKLIGKVAKNSALGTDLMIGGLAYAVVKILNDFFPSIGSYTGISGMGLIGGSSFYVPQVNQNGSMGSFVVPGAVMGAMPMAAAPASASLGRLRRTGRLM